MKFDYRQYEQIANDSRRHVDRIMDRARDEHRQPDASERATLDIEQAAAGAASLAATRAQELEESGLRGAISAGHRLTRPEDSAEIADFREFMRSGTVRNTALSTSGPDGGYVVPESLHAPLIEKVRLVDPLFSQGTIVPLEGQNTTLELPYKSGHGVAAWAAEMAARTEQVEPVFTSASATAYDLYSDQRASQTLIDSLADFDQMMTTWLYADIYEALGIALAVGTNSGQPKGVFTASAGYTQVFSGSASSVLNTTPAKMLWTLPAKYLPNAAWYCASSTLATLCGFANPASADIALVDQTSDPMRLYGKPIMVGDNIPALGAGNISLGFGDLRQGLVIVESRKPSILVDPYTASPLVRYSVLARYGACPWDVQSFVTCRCATV